MQIEHAKDTFEKERFRYNIPQDATLTSVEKRYKEFCLSEDIENGEYTDVLVWVGHFLFGSRFFELTCSMDGTIVHFEMSA